MKMSGRKRKYQSRDRHNFKRFAKDHKNIRSQKCYSTKSDNGKQQQSFSNAYYVLEQSERRKNDSIVYFERALDRLKQGFQDDEERDLFINNVLKQTEEQEITLSCDRAGSHCIEFLLDKCKDPKIIIRFMNAFIQDQELVCTDRFASHITEKLLHLGLRIVQGLFDYSEEISEEKGVSSDKEMYVADIISWIQCFGQFCLDNLHKCLQHTHACYILRSIIQVLGYHYVEENVFQRKKSRFQKKNLQKEYSDNLVETKRQVAAESVPKVFLKLLKKISKKILNIENIEDYAADGGAALVLQTVLLVLKKQLPKYCHKLVNTLTPKLFSVGSSKGIPLALTHENCSYVVERLFEVSDENQQNDIWINYLSGCLDQLVEHPVANFIVQRLFDIVKDRNQFKIMFDAVSPLFDKILKVHHSGILYSIITACNRLKAEQAQFMKNIMLGLHCWEPQDRQIYLIPLLLSLKVYEDYLNEKQTGSTVIVTLHGSLLAQAVFKFHKPIKAVKSILNMKPEELAYLSCHVQGCHILNSFMESNSVGEKNKDKLTQLLKDVLISIACDKNGSLTLSRIWVLSSLKQRCLYAEELVKKEHILKSHGCGNLLLKKCGIFHYKHRREEWKHIQKTLTKKREIFKDIVGDVR